MTDMAEDEGKQPRRFRVEKDDGTTWVVTYAGRSGLKWERVTDSSSSDRDDAPADTNEAQERPASDWEDAAATIVGALIIVGIEKSKPHVKRWLHTKVVPSAKRGWTNLKNKLRPTAVIEQEPQEISNEIATIEAVEAQSEYQYRMTSAEARQHRQDLEILAQLTAIKVRMLTNAEIIEDGNRLSVDQRTAEQGIARELADKIETSLRIEAPLDAGGDANQIDRVLNMLGYQVQEIQPEPEPHPQGNNGS